MNVRAVFLRGRSGGKSCELPKFYDWPMEFEPMTTTDEQIAALEANREALKAPLRERYAVVAAGIETLRAPERTLQTQRDASIDNLTNAQDRALCDDIKAARTQAEASGVLDLEAERKKILRALTDEDGKVRLTA